MSTSSNPLDLNVSITDTSYVLELEDDVTVTIPRQLGLAYVDKVYRMMTEPLPLLPSLLGDG